jgi:hypothetical protein
MARVDTAGGQTTTPATAENLPMRSLEPEARSVMINMYENELPVRVTAVSATAAEVPGLV